MRATTIPAQRASLDSITAQRIAAALEHLDLAAGYVRDGVAGIDAAMHVDAPADEIDPLALLRTLGDSDLSESARHAIFLNAVKVTLTLALAGA